MILLMKQAEAKKQMHWTLIAAIIMFVNSLVAAEITFKDMDSEVVLDNGIVSAAIEKSSARLLSLKHKGVELLGNGGVGYLQVVLNKRFTTPSAAVFSVPVNNGDMVDVSHKWNVDGLTFDYHYVLRRGESGIYSYMTMDYDPPLVEKVQIEQISYCLRSDKDIFKRIYVDDERIVDMPSPQELVVGKTLSPPEATLLRNGKIDHKYNYSKYVMNTDVHGWTGKGKGHWIISPSNEYMNGGPTSQELTVHQTTKTPVTLKTIHGAHYGSGVTNITSEDGKWNKICGPWFVYLNEGSDDDMWVDARKMAFQHISAWPYEWLKHPLYTPASKRSAVTGRLSITDGSSPGGALVLLAQSTDGTPQTNWQQQGRDYFFWTMANTDGTFEINKVRPGTYTLFASVSGVMGEYTLDGVTAGKDKVNNLGELKWKPRTHGKLIWQVGIPDRTAAEYFHGDDFRKWGLWLEYPKDFPDGVNFTIGKSNEATDWNFNQWCVKDDEGNYQRSPWKINFDMDRVEGEKAVLTIAVASARQARLKVLVNGKCVFEDELVSGGAAHRAGIQGFYQEKIITFDSSILISKSTNTVVLEQLRTGVFQSIMYDCIRLEVE